MLVQDRVTVMEELYMGVYQIWHSDLSKLASSRPDSAKSSSGDA